METRLRFACVWAVLAVLLPGACSQAPTSSGPAASPTRTTAPSSFISPPIQPTPGPNAFTANDCLDPPTGTATPPLADHFHVVVQVPAGWTQEPSGFSETQMLGLDGPSNYSNDPTRIALLTFMGYFTSETPEQVAAQWYGAQPGGNPEFAAQLVGQVIDCTVGNDPAAFFQYTSTRSQMVTGEPGDWSGYFVVFIHQHLAYGLRIEGTGGLDARAIHDAKAILGSWTWGAA